MFIFNYGHVIIQLSLCFPIFFGRAHALAYIYIPCFMFENVFVSSEFRGVTSWYQSFSLNELRIDHSIPGLKFSKVLDMSPTMGKVLGGETVKVYGNTLVGIAMIVTEFVCKIYS